MVKARKANESADVEDIQIDIDDIDVVKPSDIGKSDKVPWALYTQEVKKVLSEETHEEVMAKIYSLYIYAPIELPDIYTDAFCLIRNACDTDEVHIYINSPGGAVDTLCAFSAVLDDCKAEITCHVDGSAESAAFVLAFMGDKTLISDCATMVAHNQRFATPITDVANILKYIENTTGIYMNMLQKYCYKVLTPKEIKSICKDGNEVHLSCKDIAVRIAKWNAKHPTEDA